MVRVDSIGRLYQDDADTRLVFGIALHDSTLDQYGYHHVTAITYHPTTGYSTVEKPATVLQQLATWLSTDEATALDWLICKVAQFRGVSESEVKRMIERG